MIAGAWLAHAVSELRQLLRAPGYLVPTLIFPAMLFSFFGLTAANQYPYEQSHNQGTYNTVREEASAVTLGQISVDYNFLETFKIPLIAGRQLSEDFAADAIPRDMDIEAAGTTNVIISRMTVKSLGWDTPDDALGQTIFRIRDSGQAFTKDSRSQRCSRCVSPRCSTHREAETS